MKDVIRTGWIWTGLCMPLMAGILIYAWLNLPHGELLPVHWNINGEADKFWPRDKALLMLGVPVLISLGLSALMSVLPFIDPRKDNLVKSRKMYLFAWVGIQIFMTFLLAAMTISMMEGDMSLIIRFVLVALCLLLIGIGNYLPKTRPNWFAGIRTPWTLSSDYVWDKTHRLGGWLFVLSGVVSIPFVLFGSEIWMRLAFAPLILATVLVTVGYSFVVWRDAPDRA